MIRNPRLGLVAAALALVVIVTGIATVSAAGQAQAGDLSIRDAALQIWPEYDDPGVLIIFSGAFTGTNSFPQTVTFNVPQEARNLQATYRDASGSLINRQYELKDGKLTYELPGPDFHIEYYLDRLPGGNQRNIQYGLEAGYPIDRLAVTVQQPARSTEFSLEPAAAAAQPREDGLTYHSFTRENIAAGDKVDVAIAYSKADTGLSSPQLAVTESGSGASQGAAPSSSGTNSWLPWALIVAGVLLLAGIAAYYFLSRRAAEPELQPASGKGGAAAASRRPTVTASSPAGRPGSFCTQCGKPLRPDDRFCAQCGTPRRS